MSYQAIPLTPFTAKHNSTTLSFYTPRENIYWHTTFLLFWNTIYLWKLAAQHFLFFISQNSDVGINVNDKISFFQ